MVNEKLSTYLDSNSDKEITNDKSVTKDPSHTLYKI